MIQEYKVKERTKKKDAAGNITYKEKEVKKYRFKCYYTTASGERKQKCSKYYPSRPKAKAAEEQFLLDCENRIHFHGVKFSDLYKMYRSDLINNTEESTAITKLSKTDNHIRDYFKDMEIEKITPLTIRQWQMYMLDKKYIAQKEDKTKNIPAKIKKYSKTYLTELHTLLTSILEYGIRYYGLIHNPAKLQGNFKMKRVEKVNKLENFYTLDEFNRFILYVDTDWSDLFNFLYYTGCRCGEMMAATWKDYDGKSININKSLTRKTKTGTYLIKSVKTTSSCRIVDLPKILINILDKRKEYERRKECFNEKWFIFGSLSPISETSMRRKADAAMIDAGLKHITIHGFRHSHASLLINGGMNIKLISERLGHASVTETLDTYTHMFPEQRDVCVAYLNSLDTKEESQK